MKIKNPFFKKIKFIYLSDIFKVLNVKLHKNKKNFKFSSIRDLETATKYDISFLNSLKYLDKLKKTNAKYVITEKKYESIVREYSTPVVVLNSLKAVASITHLFYPTSLDDFIDFKISKSENYNYKKVKFGKNVLLGKNVKIGNNTIIGHNSIIESNVEIGSNCTIGNNVLIKYSLIGKNVVILDGAVIGKKGFGFFPDPKNNIRYPHIGIVVIEDNVEIGSNNTIDRGSISNTVIGKNSYLDNQVHIAHNVNIGKNCIITGQVGFAGSSVIGNNVQIGGQAGISGHLKIGNNVKIAGGSGVIKNIKDNTKVMGYPAKDIRNFLKENK